MTAAALALAEMLAALDTYGDPALGIHPGDVSRPWVPRIQPLRVTRRGNVYDDTLRRSVFATWGMGSIRERRIIAQAWIDGFGVTDNQQDADAVADAAEWSATPA